MAASMGNVMLRAQFRDLFISRLPFMDEILFERFDAPTLTYPQIFNVRDSSRAYEETTQLTGYGAFPQKNEGSAVTYDALLEGYSKRFEHVTFAKGFQISFEAMDDDIDGAINNSAPALARAARNSIERYIWNFYNLGFSSTLTPDGVAWFSGSHPLVGGGTANNLISGDISVANLETALNLFDNMVDHRSLEIEVDPSILLIPTELKWITHEILKSELRSDTANNASNAFNQIGLNVVMSKYITSTTDWSILTEPSQHRALVYWRADPISDHTIDFDTGNMKSKMTYRLSAGPADWVGWVGGDGS